MATISPITSTTRRRNGTVSVKSEDPGSDKLDEALAQVQAEDAKQAAAEVKASPAVSELREKIVITNGLYETPHWGVSPTGDQENWTKAPKLYELAMHLIETCPEFKHLKKFTFEVLWKAKGGTRAGQPVVAGMSMMGGLARYYGKAHFLIWFAADNCREFGLTPSDYESAMHHELCHCGHTVNDDGTEKPRKQHGIEVFPANLKRYGLWRVDLQRVSDALEQKTLWEPGRAMPEGVL